MSASSRPTCPKREQYALGRAFCDAVVDLADEATLARMWDGPDELTRRWLENTRGGLRGNDHRIALRDRFDRGEALLDRAVGSTRVVGTGVCVP